MKYKAIIFDLDGVICSTDKYHYQAWKQLADKLGIYFDKTINNRLRGVSRMDSLEIILEKTDTFFSREQKEILANEKNNIYIKLLQQMSEKDVTEEVRETLSILKKKEKKLAIGSSSKNAKFILKQLGLENYFDAVSDGTNITKSKPNPEVFIKAAEFLKVSASECLVVEDAKAGIMAAYNGGFHSAGLGEAATSSYVTYPITTFHDLVKI